jgi:S1-C subfamily serine protease
MDRRAPKGADPEPVGTCFVIGPRCVLTNSHVVDALTFGTGALVREQADVRFGQERGGGSDPEPAHLSRVVAQDPDKDLALVETVRRLDKPPWSLRPLQLSPATARRGEAVAAIGYPMYESRLPGLVAGLFNGVFDVKRASPGEILGTAVDVLSHDCTTLAGSSGSPIFSLITAKVVGVHREGLYLSRNRATSARATRQFLQEVVA